MASKSPDQTFTSDWNKIVAWASGQGISVNSYSPVYQQDLGRIQAGESPMSMSERTRAVLAAANPNNVTPAPSDNPSPTAIWGNATRDLRSIATGLEPWHLVGNLFDTVKSTVQDVLDPARMSGKTFDQTIGNWLTQSVLSFVPGAYDIGTVLKAGSLGQGISDLAQHPLITLLDLAPADIGGVAARGIARIGTEDATAAAARLGMTVDQFKEASVSKILAQVPTRKVGVDVATGMPTDRMTLGQVIDSWASKTKLGTSPAIQHFLRSWRLNSQLYTGIYQNLLGPALDAVKDLSPSDAMAFNEIFYRNQWKGENLQDLINDPGVSPKLRDAVTKFTEGPLRFVSEEALANGDVTAVRGDDGQVRMYSSRQSERVRNARDALDGALTEFMKHLPAADRVRRNIEMLDQRLPQITDSLAQAGQAARAVAQQDDSMLENVIQDYLAPGEKKSKALVFGRRRDMADKVFGEGGLVDGVVQASKGGNLADLDAKVKLLQSRLQKWGAYSVDATADPAFQAVKAQADMLARWSHLRTKMDDELRRRLIGTPKEMRAELAERRASRAEQVDELKVKHRSELDQLHTQRLNELTKIEGEYHQRLEEAQRQGVYIRSLYEAKAANASYRATPEAIREIERKRSVSRATTNRWVADGRAQAKKFLETDTARAKERWSNAEQHLRDLQNHQREVLAINFKGERMLEGDVSRTMRTYTAALREMHKAVYDNPSDEFRNVRLDAYMEQLMKHRNTASLIEATDKRLEAQGMGSDAIERLHQNPAVLREMVTLTVDDVYKNPASPAWLNPNLVDVIKQTKDEVTKTALDEVNKLIQMGYHPEWIGTAKTFDEMGGTIQAVIGHGTPHVDAAFERANHLVGIRHDAQLGVVKGAAQTLRRDATIDFVETHMVPKMISGEGVMGWLNRLGFLDDVDVGKATVPAHYSMELKRLGLTKFEPKKLFQFSMPRWEGSDEMYLPTPLVNALQRTLETEHKGYGGIFDKTTNLFRLSILGLSPRYTAHVTFGGTMLLALRSTPYALGMIGQAARALKAGTLPQEIFRGASFEGFSPYETALSEVSKRAGNQMANLAIQEHIATIQKIARPAIQAGHVLKAAADLNYKFTRYAIRLQSAVAYLDYAARADRKGSFVDEVTGETRTMTKERAMDEGIRHVAAVYGDMRSMSPFEHAVARNIMPFYGWTRHILRYVLSFPADHPYRTTILGLMAYEDSEAVPKGLPERLQFLFFLGSPSATGQVNAIDMRFMDPLRDVASYASLGGWLSGLNPVILAPWAMLNPQVIYGSNDLYPNVSFDNFYGIETAGTQGSALTGLEQVVPQLGALGAAVDAATQARSLATRNPNAFAKTIFESLNIPFAQVQNLNVKQIAASDELARYRTAEAAATTAFQSGDFSLLKGYASVPNPLNTEYEITPAQLQAVYEAALQQYPGVPPIEVLAPPPTPAGL